jgi:type VI secretion system secreted protein Hcp
MAAGDMFMKIDGARTGPIKGDSADSAHPNEIQVRAWSWGMRGNASASISAGGKAAGASQISVSELTFTKHVDSATTALMVALRSNEPIKKAVLSVRKAGGTAPVEYLKITMEKALIRSIDLHTDTDGETIIESVAIGFQKISVEYQGQEAKGGSRGTSLFETDISPS